MTDARGLTLATKFILTMVVLLAVAVGTTTLYSWKTLNGLAESQAKARRAAGESEIRSRSELLVRNVAASVGLTVADGNYAYLKELAEKSLEENPSLEWIAVIDEATGQYLTATAKAPKVESLLQDELYKKLKNDTPRISSAFQASNVGNADGVFVFGTNSFAGEQPVGQVYLSMSTKELMDVIAASVAEARAQAATSARNQLLFAALMLLIGILVAVLGSRRIARPLQQLSVQANYIAGGDFAQRVLVRSRDEIGELARSFNAMAESLGILLHEMAGKASIERELELARGVQQMMSPPSDLLPSGDFLISGRCEMAMQCGGDWWTYRQLSGNRLLLVVGDVTGHGMPAAMIAATARGAVEALSTVNEAVLSPPKLLTAVDRAIRDVGSSELHMTCFAILLDPDRGKMFFANAGHPFPYVLRPSRTGGEPELQLLQARGNPLGSPTPLVASDERDLMPNDVLILSSDGLADRVSQTGERFGEKRVRRILLDYQTDSAENAVLELSDRIVQDVNEFGGLMPLDDDLTLIVCQYTGRRSATSQTKVV